jgi:hypothetical protein
MKKTVFIPDVAKEPNVSAITTIPFMLNGWAEEKTIGYHPDRITKRLHTEKINFTGMLSGEFSGPCFSRISRIVESIIYKHYYNNIRCAGSQTYPVKTEAYSNIAFTFPGQLQMPPGLPACLKAVEAHLKVSSLKASLQIKS